MHEIRDLDKLFAVFMYDDLMIVLHMHVVDSQKVTDTIGLRILINKIDENIFTYSK